MRNTRELSSDRLQPVQLPEGLNTRVDYEAAEFGLDPDNPEDKTLIDASNGDRHIAGALWQIRHGERNPGIYHEADIENLKRAVEARRAQLGIEETGKEELED